MDDVTLTPDKEVKQSTETPTETAKEETAGDVVRSVEPKTPDTVGLDKFLEEKKGRKEAEKALKELKATIESGASRIEVAKDISDLAEEYGVDRGFLEKFEAIQRSKMGKEVEEALEKKLKPLEDRDRQDKIDKAFDKHFNAALEKMPEYKDIVNQDVIKTLSLNPANADKTFPQIIEETYGSALTGKRTIESTTPGGGKEPTEIDYDRAKNDTEYFKGIMADPALKNKYNDNLHKRIGF